MLIVRENLEKIGKLSDTDRFSSSPDIGPWLNKLIDSGKYITGTPLMISGNYVTQKSTSSSGNFLLEKEGISGFDLVWVKNLAEATEIAQNCPMVKIGHYVRDVRQVLDLPE